MKPQTTKNFLNKKDFKKLVNYCNDGILTNITNNKESINVLQTPSWLINSLQIPGKELILTFIKEESRANVSNHSINADNVVNGKKATLTTELLISTECESAENTNVFYNHKLYGNSLPAEVSNEDLKDAKINKEQFKNISHIVENKPNSLLSYQSNAFRSNYTRDKRKVLVCIYAA